MKYVIGIMIFAFVILAGCQVETTQTDIEVCDDGIVCEDDTEELVLPENANFVLDASRSDMVWKGSKIIGNSHTGEILIKSGNLVKDGEIYTGNFVIDMTSMTEVAKETAVVKHLKNEDFFNVEMYPEAKLMIKDITNSYVTADLTILDKTNEINFPTSFLYDGDKLYAMSSFEIDRTLWG